MRTRAKRRSRIERCINRLKDSRRVAIRYDHLAGSFLGLVLLSAIRHWMRYLGPA